MLLKAGLLGILQGIFEFLPVSSAGHLMLFYTLLHMKTASPVAFLSAAHLGSLVAVCFLFQKELLHSIAELLQIPGKLKANTKNYIEQLKNGVREPYHPLFTSNYGRLAMLCTVGNIPTVILGIFFRQLAEKLATNILAVGLGFLITAIFLLVAGVIQQGTKTPQDLTWWQILLLGICQGCAVFPGVSRFALVLCLLILFGQTQKSSIRCAVLMQVPVLLGAFVYTVRDLFSNGNIAVTAVAMLLCILLSALTSCFLIRTMLKRIHKRSFLGFSLYCVLLALICIACHLYLAK